MSITFACPTCGKQLKAPDEAAGRPTLCPQCKAPITVPSGGPPVPAPSSPPESVPPPLVPAPDVLAAPDVAPVQSASASILPVLPPSASQSAPPNSIQESNRILAGLMGIFFGTFGVHKFILGFTNPAMIMLGSTLALMVGGCMGACILPPLILFPILGISALHVIGLVEGIIYLSKSDDEFRQIYVVGKREWF